MAKEYAAQTIDQDARQRENISQLSEIGERVKGADGSRTPPQVQTMINPMDGELPRPARAGNDFYRKARVMRLDPTIRLARELAMAPLLMAEWEYEQRDDAPTDALPFVEKVMNEMRIRLMRTSLCGQCDYGWQPYELISEPRPDGYSGVRLKPLLQDITNILVNAADGSFFGLRQQPFLGLKIGWIYLLDAECMVISQDVEGTNWYGESTLRSIEAKYDEAEILNKSSRKYDAKIAGTHWVIYYPLGNSGFEGQDLDNGVIATRLLARAEAVGGIVVPRSVVAMTDALNAAAANTEAAQWKIELLSDKGAGQVPFIEKLKYLDVLKVRAFGFPERALLEGQFGTKAEAESHADIAVANLEVKHELLTTQYNVKLVDNLLAWNWGEQARGSVWIKPSPLADDKLLFFQKIYELMFSNPQGFMAEQSMLDMEQIRERLGLPTYTWEQLQQMQAQYGAWDPYADPYGQTIQGTGQEQTGAQLPGMQTPDTPLISFGNYVESEHPRGKGGKWSVKKHESVRGVHGVYEGEERVGTISETGKHFVTKHRRTGHSKVHKSYKDAVRHFIPSDTVVALGRLDDLIESAADRTETKPSKAQIEAGNYRKGKVRLHGMQISIENPRGTRRKKKWKKLSAHYGYIKKTEGSDGDHVDCFVGSHPESELVVVIDQVDERGRFDEHKVMLGYKNKKKAVEAYRANYPKSHRVGPTHVMTIGELRTWLERGDTTKPFRFHGELGLAFNPNEPRVPKGSYGGGQWTSGDSSSTEKALDKIGDLDDSNSEYGDIKPPFKQAKNDVHEKMFKAIKGKKPKIATVNLDQLISTQGGVEYQMLERYIKDPSNFGDRGKQEQPEIVKKNGKLFILDGTHRLTALWARNIKQAEVRLYDLDK